MSSTKKTKTLFFLDWDDTLHASTFITKTTKQNKTLDENNALQLDQLQRSLVIFLKSAINFGFVHIVTNSERGWVQLSARKFLPNVVPLLNDITII